jgi:uncharacterized protein YcnI
MAHVAVLRWVRALTLPTVLFTSALAGHVAADRVTPIASALLLLYVLTLVAVALFAWTAVRPTSRGSGGRGWCLARGCGLGFRCTRCMTGPLRVAARTTVSVASPEPEACAAVLTVYDRHIWTPASHSASIRGGCCRIFENRDIIMLQNSSPRRRIVARIGLGIGATVTAMLSLPGTAQAHVTVQPETAEGGGFSVVAFRVPNERDDASTTQLRVTLPRDQPIGSVQTTPVPGWKITTATRHLDKAIEVEGERLNTVVSEITWTATGGGIRPDQFQDFDLSLGQLPESGKLVFDALQTFSNGEKVNWNEVSTDPSVEPEHPAPILTITPAKAEGGSPATDNGGQSSEDKQVTSAVRSDSGAYSTLALVLSGAALVLSIVTAVLGWRNGRRPASAAETASASREDSNV